MNGDERKYIVSITQVENTYQEEDKNTFHI